MVKRFLLLVILLIPGHMIFAQGFNHAVGIRVGLSSGFEYRVYADDLNSYKFLLSGRDRGLQLHALKEFHLNDLFSFTDQLVFVYGFGVHVGYQRWDVKYYGYNSSWYETRTAMIAGLDALAGLEYAFNEVPVSLGIEVKPYIDFFGKEGFDLELFDFAFTVKYLF